MIRISCISQILHQRPVYSEQDFPIDSMDEQPIIIPTPIPVPTEPPHFTTPRRTTPFRKPLIATTIVVACLAITSVGVAAWKGVIPNPFVKAPNAPAVFAAFAALTSAHTVSTIHAQFEPRDAQVTPIDFSVPTTTPAETTPPPTSTDLSADFGDTLSETSSSPSPSVPAFLRLIPSDLQFNLTLTSDWQKSETLADTQSRIEGTYSANNIQATLDIEMRHVGEKTYIHPAKVPLPIPIIDLAALSDSWIDADFTNGISTVIEYGTKKTDTTKTKAATKNLDVEIEAWMKAAYENGGISLGTATQETLNGEKVWTYPVIVDGTKIMAAFNTVAEDRSTRIGDYTYTLFSDTNIAGMKKTTQSAVTIAIMNQLHGSLSVRQTDGQPAGIDFNVTIAPKTDNEKFKDSQISVSINTTFANINEPVIVTVPDHVLSFPQAMGLIEGKTSAEVDFDSQADVIQKIRTALKSYNKDNNAYPATLQDLIGYQAEYYRVKAIPNDIFTNTAFGYQLTETGYALTYSMKYTDGLSEYDQKKYIDGANTATATNLSVEAATLIDADEDSLTAAQENDLGTSDKKTDTDGDDYSDKDEVDGGFDPLTNSITGEVTKTFSAL